MEIALLLIALAVTVLVVTALADRIEVPAPLVLIVVGVAGSLQVSPDDVVAALAGLLGKDITPSVLPRDQRDGVWQTLNWSPDRCRLYGEFFENLNSGHVVFADDLEIWRGEDPIQDVLEILPAG